LGYEHEDIEDTMIIAQILEQGLERYKGRFSLEGLVRRFVDEYAYTNQGDLFDYVTTKDIRKEFQFATKFTKEQVAYACKDVEYTYALYKVLYDRLVGEGLLDTYELIEKPFTLVLADMELTGLPLNREEWLKLIVTAKESVEEALVELSKVAEIN
jgi:DNA polymerase I-like protein with 3'-5' exonuclease and polymerase domains